MQTLLQKDFLKSYYICIACIYVYWTISACVVLNCFQNNLCEARMEQSGVLFLTGPWPPLFLCIAWSLLSRFTTLGFGNISAFKYQWDIFWLVMPFCLSSSFVFVRTPHQDVVGLPSSHFGFWDLFCWFFRIHDLWYIWFLTKSSMLCYVFVW